MSLQARFHRILLIALFVCALIKAPLPLIAQGTEKKSNDEAKSPEALGRLLFEAILDKDRTASLYCPEEVTNERHIDLKGSRLVEVKAIGKTDGGEQVEKLIARIQLNVPDGELVVTSGPGERIKDRWYFITAGPKEAVLKTRDTTKSILESSKGQPK